MSKQGLAFMHDFNSSISIIKSWTELIKRDIKNTKEIKEGLVAINIEVEILKNLIDEYYKLTK